MPLPSVLTNVTQQAGALGNLTSTFAGMEANAAESIALTQKAGQLNNKVTAVEIQEKLTKKGYDAAKGLVGG